MRFAIIGAGLAGLSAAVEIRRAHPEARIDVFEATDRIGGKLKTVLFEKGRVDMGAEGFLFRRQDAVEFFESLGLGEQIVHPSGMRSILYANDEVMALPTGGVMGIPSTSEPVKHLVSEETARRIDAESEAEPIEWIVGGDVNVGELVRKRYGAEVVDRCVSALLGGVYSCTADDLGLRATIPHLAAAMDALAQEGEPVRLSTAVARLEEARPAPSDAPVFGAFRGGYAQLYEALAEKSGADIYLDSFVAGISRDDKGFSFKGAQGHYDRLLLATPAPTTALLLKELAPEAAQKLKSVKLANAVVAGMKFDSSEGLPDNSGILIATDQAGVNAKAFTFSSKKWPHIAQQVGTVVRASFGRFGDDIALKASEDELVDWALDDLKTVTGFDGREAGLAEIYTQHWFGGLPRYDEHHLETVSQVRKLLAGVEGLDATGAWAGGVGIPAVIADARDSARRLS